MRQILIVIGCLFSLLSLGQSDSTSMLLQLEQMPVDSDKVLLLLDVGDLYYIEQPEYAIQYYHKALELAVQLDYQYGEGKSWIYLGFMNNIQGEYGEAIENNQRAYRVFREIKDSIEMGKSLINIGNAYNFQSAAEIALPYYLEAADIFEAQDDQIKLATSLGNIHTLVNNIREYDQALVYAERMIELSVLTEDSILLADAHQKLGLSLMEMKRYADALVSLERALEIANLTQDQISLNVTLSNLGEFYFRQQNYSESSDYFTRGLVQAKKLGDPYYLTESLGDMGKVAMAMGKLHDARAYLLEGLGVARRSGNKLNELENLKYLAELEKSTGAYQIANEYRELHATLQDSVFDENSRNQVAALNVRYQTTVRENRIAVLESENQLQNLRLRQRNLILGVLSLGLFLLIGLLYLLRRNSRQRQEISRQAGELQEREILRLESERDLDTLRARMEGEQTERLRIAEDLHDDFGAGLSKIALLSDLLANQEPEEAGTLQKIADSSRKLQGKMGEIVWALNGRNDSLASLISYLRHYLQDFLDGTGIDYELSVPDDVPDLTLTGTQRRNVFLVIKESLHNVMKHSEADKVWVNVTLQGNTLTASVRDNGIGIPSLEVDERGNGTRNMRKRMDQLGGSIAINGAGGTTVELCLPLEREASPTKG